MELNKENKTGNRIYNRLVLVSYSVLQSFMGAGDTDNMESLDHDSIDRHFNKIIPQQKVERKPFVQQLRIETSKMKSNEVRDRGEKLASNHKSRMWFLFGQYQRCSNKTDLKNGGQEWYEF